jgi:hypothetical protein
MKVVALDNLSPYYILSNKLFIGLSTRLFQRISHFRHDLVFRLILELNECELDEDGEDKALVSVWTKLWSDLQLV